MKMPTLTKFCSFIYDGCGEVAGARAVVVTNGVAHMSVELGLLERCGLRPTAVL